MDGTETVAEQKSAMVPAGPGRWWPRTGQDAPRVCLCRWRQASDGTYFPEPFPYRWAQVTRELLSGLGFAPGLSADARRDTLERLANAGFVRLARISPGVTLLDLDSWQKHLWNCLADPFYWDEGGEARERYAKANFTRR